MTGSTAQSTLEPPAPLATTRPGLGRRAFLLLLSPFRAARRRPLRAALVSILILVAGSTFAAVGVWIWFNHHLGAAEGELEKGHNAAALVHIGKCQSIWPEHRKVLLFLSRAARRAGAWEDADEFLNKYSTRYGDEEALVLERILCRAHRGEVEAVGPALRARISDGGQTARLAREAVVNGLLSRFQWADASAVLNAWLAESPEDTIALLLRGKFLEQNLGFEDAIQTYRRVLELDPEQHDARLRLVSLLVGNRQGLEAEAELIPLRAALPGHAGVQVLWVRTLALLGRTAESRTALDACLAEHPNYAPALFERGNNALLDGDEASAEEFFARAATLEPGNGQIRNQYALALARNGKQKEAAAQYAVVKQLQEDAERLTTLINGPLRANSNDPSVLYEIGMIALRSGLITDAIRWFNRALEANPNHLETHRRLTLLYQSVENPILAARHRAIAQRLTASHKMP